MEKLTLKLFWFSMLACASLMIVGIWLGEDVAPEALFKTAAAFFIIGLANFLIWLPLIAYRFLDRLS